MPALADPFARAVEHATDILDPQPPDDGHHFEPRGACAELHDRREREVLIAGPAGTGKSRSALERVHYLAQTHPGMRALIVRKTLNSLGTSALRTWERFVVAEAMNAGAVTYYGGSAREPAQYRYSNGSAVVIGGMDKASKHMSTEYDVIFVQEAIELSEDDWESLTTRLRNHVVPFQQLLADTNPSTPTHWLKQRCDQGKTVLLNSRHTDNPVLYTDTPDGWVLTDHGREYMEILDALTGPRRLRLRDGMWVAAEGVIYDKWDDAVHVIDRFDIPEAWPRWWVVDFGYTNPFVLQWWAEDPDGRLYLYRELYHTKRLVEDHARQALDIVAPDTVYDDTGRPVDYGRWVEPKPQAVICDHDAEDRATLTRYLGIPTTAAKKQVKTGIQAVQSRIRPAGDGRPRIFVLRDSVVERDPLLERAKRPIGLAEEVPGYIWAPVPATQPDRQPKEEPLKENDHSCDCGRYMVMHRERSGPARSRRPTGRVPSVGAR